ncbi:MAG: IclR family transcriptional regulator [Burkholderiaceae bacterium]
MPKQSKTESAQDTRAESSGQGVLQRAFAVLRVMTDARGEPLRLTDIATRASLAPATAHRVLQSLAAEDLVVQVGSGKSYQLSVSFFSMAAVAGGQSSQLLQYCRPAMLRLAGMLNDTVFLLVRHNFDAVCVDRIDGVFPVRSHTGDIGGRVPLGLGQAGVMLLAELPQAEREEIMRYNVPRLSHLNFIDEISLRVEVDRALALGYVVNNHAVGLFPGTMGLSVPIRDRNAQTVAALSIAAPTERLNAERLPLVVAALQREAAAIGQQIVPFDPALRRPHQYLGTGSRP